VVSGIFFGAPPPAAASFIKTDTVTQGTWKGTYGASGEAIANDSTNYPAFAAVTFSGQSQFTWVASTASVAALQKAAAADRIASTWYFTPSFSIDVVITDGFSHQVALYCLDWDNAGRAQRIDILDAATGAVLDSRTISGFGAGQYLVWNLAGHVTIRATVTAGSNAVIGGVFFN
jgi:hypothetical protein